MQKNPIQPVADSQRIVSLDVLRGFALLGILIVNLGAFSMPAAAYFDPTAWGDLSGINWWVWAGIHVLADLKFMALFSMLFGAGVVLFSQRCEASGRSAAALHYRRMFWLLVFGLMHAYLLWYGDILVWYAICGSVVFLFRKFSPTLLIILGLMSIGLTSGIMFAAGLSAEYWPEDVRQEIVAEMKPGPETLAREVEIYQGSWLQQMEHRAPQSFVLQTSTFLVWAAWRVGGLMLLGMALFKLGVFSARRSPRFYLTLVALAWLAGIPAVAYGIQQNFANNWQAPESFFLGLQFNYWASLLVSLGWVGLVMLVCQSERFGWLKTSLAAVGKTALSNYILQTLICTTIFYGHGFGYFGQVPRIGQAGIVLAVWALQLVISPLWLKHFRFGPLEWLWRSLVYLKWQPFRRAD